MRQDLTQQLAKLDECRRCYGRGCSASVEEALLDLLGTEFPDVETLVSVHDGLLFLRAFPQSPKVAQLAEKLLAHCGQQMARLREKNADMTMLDDEQYSGIANSVIWDTFTYDVAHWLVKRYPRQISVEWDIDEQGRQMAVALPSVIPLIADDCLVEADTPYLEWLARAAGGIEKILPWLMQRVWSLPGSVEQKTAWYDALRIGIVWELGESSASRTFARRNPARIYYHDEPLIRRNQVSLADELGSPALRFRRLGRQEGEGLLDSVRDALTVRYRELYGTTRGDPKDVVQADVGRGVSIFLWGLPAERRLPLRAYHAGITFKNGVPINYIEGISLFEWMEVGFNTFYTYRDGETAWIYSKVLHLLHQLAGITCFSVYPYQLGHENEEAIKSGAFWFYRKLGFRPGRPELVSLAEREGAKIARNAAHRTSAATLRKLASHHVFYEFGEGPRGLWDSFSVRNIGLAVQRRMANRFHGDPEKMRKKAVATVQETLAMNVSDLSPLERRAFEDFAIVLALVPELASWTRAEKQAIRKIVRAKTGANEVDYLQRLQQHHGLRKAFLRLGSISSR